MEYNNYNPQGQPQQPPQQPPQPQRPPYQQPVPPYQNGPYQPQPPRENIFKARNWKDNAGTVSLILGAVSLLFSCCTISMSLLFGVVALIIALVCKFNDYGKKDLVMIALIVAIVAVSITGIFAFFENAGVNFISRFFHRTFSNFLVF